MAIETIATAAAQTASSPATVTQSAAYRKYLRGLRHRALIIQTWQIGLVAVFLGVWEIAPRAGWINPMLTSYPSAVVRTLLVLLQDGENFPVDGIHAVWTCLARPRFQRSGTV